MTPVEAHIQGICGHPCPRHEGWHLLLHVKQRPVWRRAWKPGCDKDKDRWPTPLAPGPWVAGLGPSVLNSGG